MLNEEFIMPEEYVISKEDSRFPDSLKNVKPVPKELHLIGDMSLLNSKCIALVGSRDCSFYGESMAGKLAEKLARAGACVVTGMARGIDTAANRGALSVEGGKTIAILAGGLDHCYPAENRELMEEIAERGLLISENPIGMRPRQYHFPLRNRLIAGLSDAVVVAEAGFRSGAMITAELAADLGKDVYAIPGEIDNVHASGSNGLLLDGAEMIINMDAFISSIGLTPVITKREREKLGEDETAVMEAVKRYGEITSEELCRETMLSPQRINAIVSILEIKGLVQTGLGRIFSSPLDV
jgi:DNA processing protein